MASTDHRAAGGNFPQCHKQRAEHCFFCWSFVRAAFQMWLLEGIKSFKDYHYRSPVCGTVVTFRWRSLPLDSGWKIAGYVQLCRSCPRSAGDS